jgi:hypothetical protein
VPTGNKLLPHVIDRARAQRRADRRRRRWQTVGTALVAACVAALAIVGVRVVSSPHLDAMHEAAASVPVTASLALESEADGTRVRMKCRYKAAHSDVRWAFRLVAVPKTGDPEEIAWWTAGYEDEYDIVGHTDLKRDDIDHVEIRNADGNALLTYTPS